MGKPHKHRWWAATQHLGLVICLGCGAIATDKGQMVEEVRHSREERGARIVTNYLDDDGNVVAGVEDFGGGA